MLETSVRVGKLRKCHQECHGQQKTTVPPWISLLPLQSLSEKVLGSFGVC